MTKILLYFDNKNIDTLEFAYKIIKYLKQKNCKIISSKEINRYNLVKKNKFDYILALGGDGTFLACSREYAKFNKPIMGINLGHLGYLTSSEKSNAFFALDNLLSKNYQIEKRSMLEIKNQNLTALNDI